MRDDDDLPVLSAVVRRGHVSAIRSARLALGTRRREAEGDDRRVARLDGRRRDDPRRASESDELDDTLVLDGTMPVPARRLADPPPAPERPRTVPRPLSSLELDDLVDELVERQVATLRREVRAALGRALAGIRD